MDTQDTQQAPAAVLSEERLNKIAAQTAWRAQDMALVIASHRAQAAEIERLSAIIAEWEIAADEGYGDAMAGVDITPDWLRARRRDQDAFRGAQAQTIAALSAECQEQARLNGMGAERELALRTKLDAAARRAAEEAARFPHDTQTQGACLRIANDILAMRGAAALTSPEAPAEADTLAAEPAVTGNDALLSPKTLAYWLLDTNPWAEDLGGMQRAEAAESIADYIRRAGADEREVCARVAEGNGADSDNIHICGTAKRIAAAIRARTTTNTGDRDDG